MKKINLKATLIIVGLIFAVIQLMIWIPLGYDSYMKRTFKYQDFICDGWGTYPTYYVDIIGLTEEGKIKKELYIPKEIKGMEVKEIGYQFFWTEKGKIESDNLEVVYFSSDVKISSETIFENCPKLEKFFYIGEINILNRDFLDGFVYQIINDEAGTRRVKIYGYIDTEEVEGSFNDCWPANVVYYVDNEVYSFDFYNGTIINKAPYEPTKEGYIFKGWYKELECINEWDFETDIVPEIECFEFAKYRYKVTKLYAKWETINVE
ncbi:MAG: InlB B-repeat-containing protein [Bacilli bacterium]|nr:InlB B-repeat-containing protein [Bacilli bacterium]